MSAQRQLLLFAPSSERLVKSSASVWLFSKFLWFLVYDTNFRTTKKYIPCNDHDTIRKCFVIFEQCPTIFLVNQLHKFIVLGSFKKLFYAFQSSATMQEFSDILWIDLSLFCRLKVQECRIQGRDPGGPPPPPPVIFRLKWGPKGRKKFFGDSILHLTEWNTSLWHFLTPPSENQSPEI